MISGKDILEFDEKLIRKWFVFWEFGPGKIALEKVFRSFKIDLMI